MYLLVKYQDNYADEFDVEGLKLYTQDEWVAFVQNAHKLFEGKQEVTWVFGTNEEIVWEHGVEDFLDKFTLVDITKEVYDWFFSFVTNQGKSGFFPNYIVDDAGQI